MILALAALVAIAHAGAAALVAAYSLGQLQLLVSALGHARRRPIPADTFPRVTVQLPVRNEATVVQRLLADVAALDWPRDALEIQILDDSDDETSALCAEVTEALAAEGYAITHVRRPQRTGYKAGALRDGLLTATGELIAIFDADFRPPPDFLRATVPALAADPGLGLVQARWGHLNANASLPTRSQALHLDAHFTLEQHARSHAPLMMGFNGTAGVWRRTCIDDAGGWSADTLTEDLDLAFRAQLRGWRVAYLDDVEAPAELPADVRAIRTQQHRWMKGGAQVGRKLLGPIWRSERGWPGKVQATVHLLGGTVFLAVTALLVLTPLLGPLTRREPRLDAWTTPSRLLLQGALAVLILFYATACVRRDGIFGVPRFLRDFVPFLTLSTGLALHNALAVVEGWAGRDSPFVRTPKAGDTSSVRYRPAAAGPIVVAELGLAGWGLLGLTWAVATGDGLLAAFLASQSVGCGLVALGWRTG